jgi:D-glycero-alpha-D-manno-heptose-7-phosphate kinase
VLTEQQGNTADKMSQLLAMREQAQRLRASLRNGFDPRGVGKVLDEGWQFKRQLASSITNDQIDQWYQRAQAAGASGGKLCGAGGGGFLLFIVLPEHQAQVRAALSDLFELPIKYEPQGSRLLMQKMD